MAFCGGNHFLHCLRRNVDLKVLLFNNRIYGLTRTVFADLLKGTEQIFSMGSIGSPLHPFPSRSVRKLPRRPDSGYQYKTFIRFTSSSCPQRDCLVEIYQNCPVFNPTAWDHTTDRILRTSFIYKRQTAYIRKGSR